MRRSFWEGKGKATFEEVAHEVERMHAVEHGRAEQVTTVGKDGEDLTWVAS